MPKLYSGRTILATLQRAGFHIVGQKGSHIKLQRKDQDRTLTVIVPNHKQVTMGTFSSILRQAEMSKKEFELLLK